MIEPGTVNDDGSIELRTSRVFMPRVTEGRVFIARRNLERAMSFGWEYVGTMPPPESPAALVVVARGTSEAHSRHDQRIAEAIELLNRAGYKVRRNEEPDLPFEARWTGSLEKAPFALTGEFFVMIGTRLARIEKRFDAREVSYRFPADVMAHPLSDAIARLVVDDLRPKFTLALREAGVGS